MAQVWAGTSLGRGSIRATSFSGVADAWRSGGSTAFGALASVGLGPERRWLLHHPKPKNKVL